MQARRGWIGAASVFLVMSFTGEAPTGAVRISQIYPGGGPDADGSSAFNVDYVELFNAGPTPVDLSGWVLAYDDYDLQPHPIQPFECAGCTGTIPAGTVIQPCRYLLVTLGPVAPLNKPLPVTADVHLDTPSMIGDWLGSVALLAGGAPDGTCTPPMEVDLVGWKGTGTGTTFIRCYLGSPSGAFGTPAALVRQGAGMTDTGNNATDFVVTAIFAPHNSSSAANAICLQTPTVPGSWGQVKAVYR